MKKISILIIAILCLILVGCNNYKPYIYLYEDQYQGGSGSREIISTYQAYLDQSRFKGEYNEEFFVNNDLIIFNFRAHYTENDVRVIWAKRVGHDIKIDIKLMSYAKDEMSFYDNEVTITYLACSVSKYLGPESSEVDRVGILVINERYRHVYRSVYYICDKK